MILEKIRLQTREQHEQLDSIPLLKPLSEGNITRIQYLKILEAFYGYFSPVEREIEKFGELKDYIHDMQERRKSSWLLNDIEVLDKDHKKVSLCTDLPEINNAANAFGALYVLEGSTLGGTLIAKKINEHLCFSKETGASFFCGYGKQTRERWDIFKNALILYTTNNPDDEELIIRTAKDTFYKFSIWLGKNYECTGIN